MKFIIFAYLIFSQSFNVDCSFLDFMSRSFNDFTRYVVRAYDNIKEKIAKLVLSQYVEDGEKSVDRMLHGDMKNVFNDYVISQTEHDEVKTHNIDPRSPSVILATPNLSFWHGRKMESHIVLTKDGYYLTIHRLTLKQPVQENRTVLLHHGLLGSSTDWILLGPKKSLPYLLADAGYDVWIANARGNYYSRGHISMQLDSLDYWKFSWQEIGEFDLSAVIDYIKHMKNSSESINFIGHSMGATALLVLLSTVPKYNEYLRMGILLAPLAYMNNVKGPIKVMSGMSCKVIKLMGQGEFLPSRKVPSLLATNYCNGPKLFCSNPLLFLSGIHQDVKWNANFIARLLQHVPAGGSTNTLLHYMQVAYNGKFHKFNQPDNEFPLHNVTLPMAFISSDADWLATTPNVLKLYFSLSSPIDHHIIHNQPMEHTDLVWGNDAPDLVFQKVLKYIDNGVGWTYLNELI